MANSLTPRSTSLSKSATRRQHRNNLPKSDSLSEETAKYIEHLEAELASAQTQLSSMTSPTVMQARSLKMRALNAETRALQQQLVQWETRFHERVQEETEQRVKIEAGLRQRIRTLETESEEYSQKVQELQGQLRWNSTSLNATETANIELERRIEVITEILASPKKAEQEVPVVSNAEKRHSRQRSMLPRFPTTGSLAAPTRGLEMTGPTTPLPDGSSGPMARFMPENLHRPPPFASSQSVDFAIADGVAENVPSSAESGISSKRSSRLSWSTPDSAAHGEIEASLTGTGRPSRRMRRFHGGSHMPKPLLLPSTNCLADTIPATAPPLDAKETPPSFPFPEVPSTQAFEHLVSPLPGRRRALTCDEGLTAAMRRASSISRILTSSPPFTATPEPSCSSDAEVLRMASPDNMSSEKTLRDFSSLGSAVGRNLFEELQRAKGSEGVSASDISKDTSSSHSLSSGGRRFSKIQSDATAWRSMSGSYDGLRQRDWTLHQRSTSDMTALPHLQALYPLARRRSNSELSPPNRSTSSLLSDLWKQPFTTARQCLIRAQTLSRSSLTVQRVQLWLVQFLLGPMVTRRIMFSSMRNARSRHRSESATSLGMGLQLTPTRSSRSSDAVVTPEQMESLDSALACGSRGEGGKHVSNGDEVDEAACPLHGLWFSRHSPWLWLRFSLTLAIALGAAIRDGPAVVMGLEDCSKRERERKLV